MKYNIPTFKVRIVKEGKGKGDAPYLTGSKEAAKLACWILKNQQTDRENVFIILLNIKNKVIGWNMVSIGGMDQATVLMPQLLRVVLLSGAASFIVCHNHPSGDPKPSGKDIELTKILIESAKMIGLNLTDHIICTTEGEYSSLRDEGVF